MQMWHLRLSRRIPRCAPHLRREICGSPPSLGPVTQTEEDKQSPSPSPAQGQSALFAALPGVATAAGVMSEAWAERVRELSCYEVRRTGTFCEWWQAR